jgi:Neocarzinostatin family
LFVALLAACGSSGSKKAADTTAATSGSSTSATATPTLPPPAVTTTTVDPNAPTITITPSTGLHDSQMVTVSGAKFPPGHKIGITECADKGDATGATDCDLAGIGPTIKAVAADGTYSAQFAVKLKPSATDAACGAAQPCVISLGELAASGPHPSDSITFAG